MAACLAGGLAGCGAAASPAAPPTSAPAVPTAPTEARAKLAALAAAAKDRRLVASYTTGTGRSVLVVLAQDGSWRIDVPGGAHGGTVDIAIASTPNGLVHCVLPTGPCVKIPSLTPAVDPRVTHVFTDWRDVFTDRRAPLSVAAANAPAGVAGACYSVEPTAASLAAPVDPGIYCYLPDGTLTGAVTGSGTLVLAGTPSAAPPTIVLPGAIVPGQPLKTAAPPSPSPSAPGAPAP